MFYMGRSSAPICSSAFRVLALRHASALSQTSSESEIIPGCARFSGCRSQRRDTAMGKSTNPYKVAKHLAATLGGERRKDLK